MSGPPRPLELTRLAAEHLAGKGVEDARLDAELLLAHVLGVRRLDLYLQFERPLEPDEVEAYRAVVRRRAAREPLQYITGEAHFRELTLRVDPRVLIPRPETEVLVGAVLEWASARGVGGVALDLGTGSGAIALSLLAEGPFERVVATDVSDGALELAGQNAARAGVAARLELRPGPLYEPIGGGEEYDVIVANPPYVPDSERDGLMAEVRDHEPEVALFAGPRGLDVIEGIVRGAPAHLVEGGLVALEVGLGQASAVATLMRSGGFAEPRILKDLTGRERMVLATYD
ncbi:MAG: peptide chain release factor N(5)-glutamine methyltransferase [Gemmatimonadota bacterium]